MREREHIVEELWRCLSSISGVESVTRNSVNPPSINDLPAIQFFEMEDTVEDVDMRGASRPPIYKRRLNVVVEFYLAPSSEGSANKELQALAGRVKQSIYRCAWNAVKVEVKEMRGGRIHRPATGSFVIGSSITLGLTYIEDVSMLTTTSSTTSSTSSTVSSTSSVSTTSTTVSESSTSSTGTSSSSSSTTATIGVTSTSSTTTSSTSSSSSSSTSSTSVSSTSSTTSTTLARDRWQPGDEWGDGDVWGPAI